MDAFEEKVIEAVISWYKYILRSKDNLNSAEKHLFNAILDYQKEKRKSSHYASELYDIERPTTPVPGPLQTELMEKSKEDNE